MYKRFGYSQKGVCTEKIKDESVFTKRSRLFTRIYKKIFTVPRPRPRPPLPTLAFSECVDNTGRSPASRVYLRELVQQENVQCSKQIHLQGPSRLIEAVY